MILLSPKSVPKNKAFTLVELMVVILVIGILVTIMAGALVKWMAWQRDPTNPNSSVSQTINTIKQAVTRIIQDIQQKAKQDYQALSTADKGLFQSLATDLNMKNVSNQGFFVLTEMEPTNRAIIAYANTRTLRAFPIDAAKIALFQNTSSTSVSNDIGSARSKPFFQFDFNTPIPALTTNATLANNTTLSSGTTLRDVTECPSNRPIAYPVINTIFYSNFFLSLDALTRKNTTAIENSIYKAHLAANSLIASTPTRNSSSCLLMALESHPKGLKVEDLGSGSISTDSTGVRIIQPGGAVIYHKIHYVDAADYAADKSFKIGSLRVDIAYDTE
jgi:prepilin-type N-terminal cleavage/methylation domain-containing protein